MSLLFARLGALSYASWGAFHVYVSWQLLQLAMANKGLVQGRLLQLAAYILTISLFCIAIAAWRNWQNDRLGYWLNLLVIGWADTIWVIAVVAPGYVDRVRGLIPPGIYLAGAILTTAARRGHTEERRKT